MRKYLLHILIISFIFLVIPITSATGGSITLRSYYKDLSVAEVQSMSNVSISSKNEDGFCGYSTINHDYNLKAIKGDKVVVGNATGLMWHQSGSDDEMVWHEALEWIRKLNKSGYAGCQDWRLPTVEEAASLLEPSKRNGLCIDPVFSNVQSFIYTGDRNDATRGYPDTYSAEVKEFFDLFGELSKTLTSVGYTWYVSLRGGNVMMTINIVNDAFVRPVRPVLRDVGFYFNRGNDHSNSGKYEEAIESYKQAIKLNPDDAYAHTRLGVAYRKSGMYEDAIESYKQAIRINPDDADAHIGLGIAYGRLGKHKEAIESYKQAIRIDPDFVLAHNGLGVAYRNLGKYEEAIESYKQVIEIDPDDASTHYYLGLSYIMLKDRGSAME
ncbi:MAG: tetratricopeptide repeat protein, partial [Anaerolineales bacterium]|nr:tetratricopeptide repeat protein [Anaerolineales bacterium]